MIKKINLIDLHEATKNKLEEKTDLRAYDIVPEDVKAPFLSLQCVGKEDSSTKTMFIEKFIFYIHCFAEGDSSTKIYDVINKVEEALTEDIELPSEYNLVNQVEEGIVQIITETETFEKRAILEYSFNICYGFKCKI